MDESVVTHWGDEEWLCLNDAPPVTEVVAEFNCVFVCGCLRKERSDL